MQLKRQKSNAKWSILETHEFSLFEKWKTLYKWNWLIESILNEYVGDDIIKETNWDGGAL